MDTPFLKADWRYLAMASFAVDPALLRPLVPPGTELDSYAGRDFVSVSGCLCQGTQAFGIRVPFQQNLEGVTLRFYVRRRMPGGLRRGVVIVHEIVPTRTAAWAARYIHGGTCQALSMRHAIERQEANLRVEYAWRRRGAWESLKMQAVGIPQSFRKGSLEEFIAEHGWGYTARLGGCSEYRVQHPRWSFWPATGAELKCDVAALYGPEFVESLTSSPASAFIADGSEVIIGRRSPCPVEDPADLIDLKDLRPPVFNS
jgi:uncharacterized protein YqjF (DUF2071 family)